MAGTNIPPYNNQVVSSGRTSDNFIENIDANQVIGKGSTNSIPTGNQPINQENTNSVKNNNHVIGKNAEYPLKKGNQVTLDKSTTYPFKNNNQPISEASTNTFKKNNQVPVTTVRKAETGEGYKTPAQHIESVTLNQPTSTKRTADNGITGIKSKIIPESLESDEDIKRLLQSSNIYSRTDIQWYTKFNRFGCLDPYNAVTNTREYLFFTKPDLHICEPGYDYLVINPQLQNNGFFTELINRYPSVVRQLQKSSVKVKDTNYTPFMNILSNAVKNTLDLPDIESTLIDTAATAFGTSIEYRGDGFSSDEKHQFSLEFEDTKYLEIYMLVKAYEEYERAKKIGLVSPPNIDNAPITDDALDGAGYPISHNIYIREKRLHDQFSVYKFIVDEDYETILYYAVLKGVTFMNVPRDAFSDLKVDGGLRYNINMKAQFVDDMKPWILIEFNNLVKSTMSLSKTPVILPIYDTTRNMVDGRWAKIPYIYRQNNTGSSDTWKAPNDMNYMYKLKWRLS